MTKCPICYKEPDPLKVQTIIADTECKGYKSFDPTDPIVVTEDTIFCSLDCFAVAVIRDEQAHHE